MPVTVSIFWRFAIAGLTLMAVLRLMGRLRPLSATNHLWCLIQGCCVFCINFWCFYVGATKINTGLESVIFSMAVLFNALNGMLFFGQRLPRRFWIAVMMGLAGIVMLFWRDLHSQGLSPSLLAGIGLSLIGTLGFSLGNMLSLRHQRQHLDILTTNSWAMVYGSLVMAVICLIRGERFMPGTSVSYLTALFYLAILGSVLGFGAYFRLVGRIGAANAAYCTLLFPIIALSISTVFEGYQWHREAIIGLIFILCGNFLMFAPRGRLRLPWAVHSGKE